MATVSLFDWDEKNTASVNTLSDGSSFTGLAKVVPVKVTWGNSGTSTGSGDAAFTTSNVSDATDLVVTEADESTTRPYEIESLDTSNNVAWLWVYGSWDSDGSEQIVVGAGNGSTDYSMSSIGLNPWGETGVNNELALHNEETSAPIIDSSPSGNDSNNVSGVIFEQEGQFADSILWDGADDFVELPANIYDATSTVTISTWVKTTSNNTQIILGNRDSSFDAGAAFFIASDGIPTVNLNNSYSTQNYSANTAVNDGNWHHLVFEWDGSDTVDLYIDGNLDASVTIPFSQVDSQDVTAYGSQSGGSTGINVGTNVFNGEIDETNVYSETKTDAYWQAEFDASPKGGQQFFTWSGAEPTTVAVTDTATTATSTSTAGTAIPTAVWKTRASVAYGKHQYGAIQPFGVTRALGATATSKSTAGTAQETGTATDTATTATSTSTAGTATFQNMVLTDSATEATGTSSAEVAETYIFGIPDEISVYIDGKRFTNFTDIGIGKRKNEIDTFSFTAYITDDEDRQFVQENKDVIIFEGVDKLFKGRLNKVEYKSNFRAQCEGDGMAVKLLNRKTNRETYNNSPADDIVKAEVPETLMPYGTIETAPLTSLRFDHDNKARAVAGAANAVGYDWYIDQKREDRFEKDYLNFVEEMGRDEVQETFTIGENARMVERDKDDGFIANDLTLLGRGDGINQLQTRIFAATTRFTQLDGDLSATNTGNFTVDSTANFGDAGDTVHIRVGSEVVSADIVDDTTFSINTRGLDAYDGEETEQIKHQDRITVWLRENLTQGIGPFTAEDRDTAESGSSIETHGVREDRSTDKTIVDLSTLEKVADRELRNRFEDIFRVQVKPLDPRATKDLELGDTVVAEDLTAMDVSDEFEIVGMDINRRSTGEGTTLHLSNRPRRLTERLSKIERDRNTLNAHMQGATNIDSQTFSDNCDNSHPLDSSIYVPSDVVEVNKFQLVFRRESFRGYIQNPQHDHTVDIPEHTHDIPKDNLDHRHEIEIEHTHVSNGDGNDTTRGSYVGGFHDTAADPDTITTNAAFWNPSTLTSSGGGGSTETTEDGGPSYGIFEPGSEADVDVDIVVDGTTVTTVTGVSVGDEISDEIDLKNALSDPIAGEYHEVKLVPTGRCRLQADIFQKVFIESTL